MLGYVVASFVCKNLPNRPILVRFVLNNPTINGNRPKKTIRLKTQCKTASEYSLPTGLLLGMQY